jgi:hypothetical protein
MDESSRQNRCHEADDRLDGSREFHFRRLQGKMRQRPGFRSLQLRQVRYRLSHCIDPAVAVVIFEPGRYRIS